MNVRQLLEALGFDAREDFDDRIRWALVELYVRRQQVES